ncbi:MULTISPECIES: hypothetical protein [Tsukamurella]|uniref:Uncharacterized protein n=1 Tax=Tsukamurella paurometabola TaxID=2061 RepID=A0A3P8K4X7_TSUPA|nr:hypothetical protein [Tsukamurella paurometabola]MBS4101026.1 hypothetical protein [Tsukamurella paurometabola]UEA82888.1 hypothetical protein LK411_21415 [Tsukamurella paurometabola]VDR39964.1 Uncharacterised protein [Tsukamurella paurometabola]
MHAIAQWWDSVELWLTGLPYVLQVSLVMVVLAVIAMLVVRVLSALIDRVADALDARLERSGRADVAGQRAGEGNDESV